MVSVDAVPLNFLKYRLNGVGKAAKSAILSTTMKVVPIPTGLLLLINLPEAELPVPLYARVAQSHKLAKPKSTYPVDGTLSSILNDAEKSALPKPKLFGSAPSPASLVKLVAS